MKISKKILITLLIILSTAFIFNMLIFKNLSSATTNTTNSTKSNATTNTTTNTTNITKENTEKISIESKKITIKVDTSKRKYTGQKITPSVKVFYGDKRLKVNKDYTVKYENNKNIGKASIIIQGKGNYKGKVTKKFTIIPKRPEIYTVKTTKNKELKIHWKKDSKVDGYIIYMATSKDGKYKKIKTIKNKNTTRYVKTNLKPGTYYFKIISYKTVNGKQIKSNYSKKKKGKVSGKLLANIKLTSTSSNENRNTNLKVASKAINGIVLKPGQTFVWSKVVGQATYAKGYKDAIVFVGNGQQLGTGGGICQVSSTLYQAARKAKLKIIERHEHSLPVSYTTKGNDATVAYGSKNFIFKNNKSYSIKILMYANGSSTTCKIYKL